MGHKILDLTQKNQMYTDYTISPPLFGLIVNL